MLMLAPNHEQQLKLHTYVISILDSFFGQYY